MGATIKKSPFRLSQFIVREFQITREPLKQGKIEFNINPSGVIDQANNIFRLMLEVSIKDKSLSFDIKMIAYGFFEFKNNIDQAQMSNYFYTNAPAIIFPYIRAYISSITALSGLKAINLPVMNLTPLRDKLKANITNDIINQ